MNKAAGDLQSAPAQPLRGIIFVLAAVFVFASMDTINKHLAINYPVPLIMAVRYLINLLGVILIFAPRHGRALLQMKRRQLVLFRGASLAASSLLMGFALQLMPVAETVAIIYLAPFGVLLLSGPLLKEPVKLAGWIATATGFVGLLFIVRPGSCLDPTGVMFAICAIVGTISYHMLSRLLAKTESTMAFLFYTALIGTVIFCALLPWNIRGPTPTPLDVALFIAIGVLSLIGHFLFTAAYREAPVSLLTPVNYVHLVWAALLGWLVFGHIPDGLSLIGIALVASAGAGNTLWAHFAKEKLTSITEISEV